LPKDPDDSFFVPFGLARTQVTSGQRDFVGFHVLVQTPLEVQNYMLPSACVSKWTVLVPPATLNGNPLVQAREQFGPWIERLRKSSNDVKIYEDLKTFGEWLNPADPGQERESSALLILSHHEANSIFFDQDVDAISATNMTRLFASPSIAIINACGTANPGAFEFVREFNRNGIYTVLASSIEVDARLGGAFSKLLAERLESGKTRPAYNLELAVFDALTELSKVSDEYGVDSHPYGPRALIFTVLGNGGVRACIPSQQAAR
jgi:hypothetical protein